MTTTFQPSLNSETYNGWSNYETWNVSLWIQNDEGLYHLALEAGDYETFVDALEAVTFNDRSTPDGVKWNSPKVNRIEINEMLKDL
jgi:hypothetical protein